MKIQVLHDEQGNILSLAIVENGVIDGLSIVPKQKQSIKTMDIPSTLHVKVNNEEDFNKFLEQIKQYKVDVANKDGKLIRKSA
jgi:uncharacterized NAD-dependent epimerase/dehydratase family protein